MSRQPVYQDINGVRCTVTQADDPAMDLIRDPDVYSAPDTSIFRDDCYICVDPEFAAMGLPLCTACEACKIGHVAADDTECDSCGADAYELWMEARKHERTNDPEASAT